MTEPRYKAEIVQDIRIEHIELKPNSKQSTILPKSEIIKCSIRKTAHHYVDVCYCLFNDSKNLFHQLERGRSEVSVFVSTKKNRTPYELFSGLIYDNLQFEKIRQLRVVRFVARSYAVILTTQMLNQQEIQYSRGYGEVIRKLVHPIGAFNTADVIEEQSEEGTVYFDMISVLDAIRYLAYVKGWCLEFKGSSILFRPCKKPRGPELILDLKDIERVSIKK
jgi:hypothetical protein